MKNGKKLLLTLFALALAITMLPATAKAATYENAFDQYGLFLGQSYSGYESITVTSDGRLQKGKSRTEYLPWIRMYKTKDSKDYPVSSVYLRTKYIANAPYSYNRIVNVKTNSKNLKAIIANTTHTTGSVTTYSDGTVEKDDPNDSSSSEIKLLAKKAGTYKVTVTVELGSRTSNSKINVTKTATVYVSKKYSPYFEFKKAKYTTNGTIAGSTVVPKLVKSSDATDYKTYYATSTKKYVYKDSDGDTVTEGDLCWKAFKPGKKKIKLNTKTSLTYDSSTAYAIDKCIKSSFYPQTYFMVTYKDKYTGLYNTSTTTVSKYKKL